MAGGTEEGGAGEDTEMEDGPGGVEEAVWVDAVADEANDVGSIFMKVITDAMPQASATLKAMEEQAILKAAAESEKKEKAAEKEREKMEKAEEKEREKKEKTEEKEREKKEKAGDKEREKKGKANKAAEEKKNQKYNRGRYRRCRGRRREQ